MRGRIVRDGSLRLYHIRVQNQLRVHRSSPQVLLYTHISPIFFFSSFVLDKHPSSLGQTTLITPLRMQDMYSVNAPRAEADDGFDFQLYRYTPSLPGAIIAVIVFAILTCAHLWRLLRSRAFYFTAFTVGGACKYDWAHSRRESSRQSFAIEPNQKKKGCTDFSRLFFFVARSPDCRLLWPDMVSLR